MTALSTQLSGVGRSSESEHGSGQLHLASRSAPVLSGEGESWSAALVFTWRRISKMQIHLDTDLGGDPDDACALAVLLSWRWPELYERTLVLASGRLPDRSGGWLRFDDIDPRLLETLAKKLRLRVED